MAKRARNFRGTQADLKTSIWQEVFFPLELVLLQTSPVYYGLGIPHGQGSGVVLVPGFLGSDSYLSTLHFWLRMVGYRPYFSGMGVNAHCPNLLIRYRLIQTIDRAVQESGGKIHLVGHSLGGIIARSVAAQHPSKIASVITLGSPLRGGTAHSAVLKAAEAVRERIMCSACDDILPDCYTDKCTCDFLKGFKSALQEGILQSAIFTRNDGVVHWRNCLSGADGQSFEVNGTHVGLVFNAAAYAIIAHRLAAADALQFSTDSAHTHKVARCTQSST